MSGNYSHKIVFDYDMLKDFLVRTGFTKVERVSPGFSHSEVMQNETIDQHLSVSIIMEGVK